MKGRNSGRSRYEEQAEALAAPIAEAFGTYIYDVEYVRDGEEYYLNIYIDKEDGVTINDCENVSRQLSDALDEADFIADPYTLVVSSPGLGRRLSKDRHLQNSIGERVEIHLYKPHPETGAKDMSGVLLSFDDSKVVILADPPAEDAVKGKGKGKKGKKSREKTKNQSREEEIPAPDPGAENDVRQEREKEQGIERSLIASIRLAFDFYTH